MIIAENTTNKKFLKLTSSILSELRKQLSNSEMILFLTIKSLNPFGDRKFSIAELTEILRVSKSTIYKNLRKLSKLGFITYESQRTTTYEVHQIALTATESKTIELQKLKKFEDQELKLAKTELKTSQTELKRIEFDSQESDCERVLGMSQTSLETKKILSSIEDNCNLKEIPDKIISEVKSNQELGEKESQATNEVNLKTADQTIVQTTPPCSANELEKEYDPTIHKDYNSVILYLANYYYQNFPENTIDIFQGKKKAIAHIKKSRDNWLNAHKNYLRSNKSPYPDRTGIAEKKEDIPVNYHALQLLSNFVKNLKGK